MNLIDLRNGLSVSDLLTLFGAAIVVAILIEIIKRTLAWTPEFTERFGPVVACLAGILLSVLAAIWLAADPIQAALTGFLAGALAAGLYDVAASRIAAIFARLSTGPDGPA